MVNWDVPDTDTPVSSIRIENQFLPHNHLEEIENSLVIACGNAAIGKKQPPIHIPQVDRSASAQGEVCDRGTVNRLLTSVHFKVSLVVCAVVTMSVLPEESMLNRSRECAMAQRTVYSLFEGLLCSNFMYNILRA